MKALFTSKAFYLNKAIEFRVSKLSDNLYIADSNQTEIKQFSIRKISGEWISDNEMTQTITAGIGTMIEKTDNNRMLKIQQFVRSCFTQPEQETEQKPAPMVIQNLARM